jgi:hypothetical protein
VIATTSLAVLFHFEQARMSTMALFAGAAL